MLASWIVYPYFGIFIFNLQKIVVTSVYCLCITNFSAVQFLRKKLGLQKWPKIFSARKMTTNIFILTKNFIQAVSLFHTVCTSHVKRKSQRCPVESLEILQIRTHPWNLSHLTCECRYVHPSIHLMQHRNAFEHKLDLWEWIWSNKGRLISSCLSILLS